MLALVVVASGCKGKAKKREAEPSAKTDRPAAPSVTSPPASSATKSAPPNLPAIAATEKALSDHMRGLVALRDPVREAELAKGLKLAEPAAWFANAFGAEQGEALSAAYKDDRLVDTLAKTIRFNQSAHDRRKIVVEKFESPDNGGATGLQARALEAMVKPTALYSIRYSALKAAGTVHLFNFVHDGERFRYVGPLENLGGKRPNAAALKRLRLRQRDAKSKER